MDRKTKVTDVNPDLPLREFKRILEAAGSPAASSFQESYDAIVKNRVSPAFSLAFFNHESGMGKLGVCHDYDTKSPGNTRSSRTGQTDGVDVPDKGHYVKYPKWEDGWNDATYRLVDPTFAYVGLSSIDDILYKWAPPSDSNDTEAYINSVVQFMEANTMPAMPTPADIGGYNVYYQRAADVGPWRDLSNVTMFIVHDTEGKFQGDLQVLTSAADPVESTHFLINTNGDVWQTLDINETAWTPGNDDYAKRSINVEMTGYQTGYYTDQQYIALAGLYKWVVGQGCPIPCEYVGTKGLPGILGHQDVPNPFGPGFGGASGHTDPGPNFYWGKFLDLCRGGSLEVFDPNPDKFDVGVGFLQAAAARHHTFLTNEQYFVPEDPTKLAGLGKRSFAWAKDRSGIVFTYLAFGPTDGNPNWQIHVVRDA